MKMYLAIAGTALVLATSALAAEPKTTTPKTIACAVCGPEHKMNVKDATAKKLYADYKGNRYFFCEAGEIPAFKKHPEKYAKAPHIPTPKN